MKAYRWKRWKRRKNRCKRAPHPNARYLEWWLPSISNGGLPVASPWWNVLTVEERVCSPQSRASSGSNHMIHAKYRPRDWLALVFVRTNRLGRGLKIHDEGHEQHRSDRAGISTAHLDTPDESSDLASRLYPSQDVLLSYQAVAATGQEIAMA
jgi:hypothetical protein